MGCSSRVGKCAQTKKVGSGLDCVLVACVLVACVLVACVLVACLGVYSSSYVRVFFPTGFFTVMRFKEAPGFVFFSVVFVSFVLFESDPATRGSVGFLGASRNPIRFGFTERTEFSDLRSVAVRCGAWRCFFLGNFRMFGGRKSFFTGYMYLLGEVPRCR
jgi:hypothetical protein